MRKLHDPDDYHVYMIDLPLRVRALVSFDDSGYPSIFINAKLDALTQRRALKHELEHITANDGFNGLPVKTVETRIDIA